MIFLKGVFNITFHRMQGTVHEESTISCERGKYIALKSGYSVAQTNAPGSFYCFSGVFLVLFWGVFGALCKGRAL